MESVLSKEQHEKVFAAGVASVLCEKQAGTLADLASGAKNIFKGIAGLPKDLMLYGALAGGAVGVGGQMLTEHLTEESPEEELNRTLEAMYAAKRKELDDAKWMSRVRAMRSDLMANHKKMSVEEYAEKYNSLIDALNERMS